MNNDNKHSSTVNRFIMVSAVIILPALMILYLIMSLMSPAKRMSVLKEQYMAAGEGEEQPDSRFYNDSAYLHLLREKGFYQSRIAMAETDSVYLTIIVPDSIMNLEISGVVVHSAKIREIRVSRMLTKGNDFVISSLLSAPLTISNEYSTIRKEPIMVRIAPKDTSEYKPDVLPDTSDIAPVNFIMKTDKGVKIYIYQYEAGRGSRFKLFCFDLRGRLRDFTSAMAGVIRLRVPEYQPSIRIRLQKADAKIIYRALPRKGQIAVYR